MGNLSAVKKAHVSALVSWNGMTYAEALALAEKSTCEELNEKTYASDSILAAKSGIEKHLLNGREIDIKILTGEKNAPEGYFEKQSNQIIKNMTSAQILESVMMVLKEIHDNWVAGNAKKYNRDAEKGDARLFQHLPMQMIGINEVAKNLMFLAPILEKFGIKTGEMQKEPYGQFKPTPAVETAYKLFAKKSFEKNGFKRGGVVELGEKLPGIITSYKPLQGELRVDQDRRDYMLGRVTQLADQVDLCLGDTEQLMNPSFLVGNEKLGKLDLPELEPTR